MALDDLLNGLSVLGGERVATQTLGADQGPLGKNRAGKKCQDKPGKTNRQVGMSHDMSWASSPTKTPATQSGAPTTVGSTKALATVKGRTASA